MTRTAFQIAGRRMRFAGAFADTAHLRNGPVHRLLAVVGRRHGFFRHYGHFPGSPGNVFDRRRDFFHDGRCFIDRRHLVLAAFGHFRNGTGDLVGRIRRLVSAGSQLFAGGGKLVGLVLYLLHQTA